MRPPERRNPRTGTDRMVRRGLSGLRGAEPDPGVWDRIASELGPGPGVQPRPRWRLNLPMAALAGAMCLVVLALGGLNVRPYANMSTTPALEAASAELDVALIRQPAVNPRAVDLSLPLRETTPFWAGSELAGWHYPQVAFNADFWPARTVDSSGGAALALDARLQ